LVAPVTPQYCQVCGAPLRRPDLPSLGGPPWICSGCGRAVYEDPKLAVAGVVSHNGSVVLLRRAQRDKAYNRWILPGGHVNRGEEMEAATLREINEETGLEADLRGLVGVYSYPDHPVVLAVYQARALSLDLRPSAEALEIAFFRQSEIPWDELGYRSTGDALRDYFSKLK
jgi:ADP-ribose pyrophosphatase YjhB (NUDIX family)